MQDTRIVLLLSIEEREQFERARKRIRFALDMAESGLLDYESVDELCRSLALALRDLDAINSPTPRQLRVA